MNKNILPQDLQSLRRNYLFSGLDGDQFLEAMSHAASLEVQAGQLLFARGDAVEAFYWVAEGLVRLFRSSPQGDEKVIELVGPGRFFAEAALFMGGHFPVNAAAQVDSRLIAVDGTSFRTWLAQDASRCFKLLAGMSAKLHKLVDEIDGLTLMKGADRLLQYLLDHSEPDAAGQTVVDLEAPKQIIASRIGVKPETLSRLLHKLSGLGYIEVKENHILIKDEDSLRTAGGLD
ncbi:MAG: Crp/Fnr family transcriptional regulator [Hydrogenophilales bacterium CG15_BIG_FIL_POST_REV_8_21_14_020_62_31]|nr:MAG: Crp/Fnr family transcriptional regulator [Hydrogenophilales bacterium CG15_BIG_FIL_POST_REV_8_21_14_020_62_31]PIW71298.1 MAG: Crp/Fnr family transcriptional regulator [Hydrogenophilales bacterium CG12_big_fil_rev_8_21_14_0_65_61_21]PIY97970.1 MAG: Crp/Fnr family transcriptional regulator [Hydrogenophilales bacterium CG_4_10_14_0_8_um_filter_62_70]